MKRPCAHNQRNGPGNTRQDAPRPDKFEINSQNPDNDENTSGVRPGHRSFSAKV